MGQAPFEPPNVKGWPVNEQWLNLRWLQARRRGLQQLLTDEEVWASAALPAELSVGLTPIPPLGLQLPVAATRENLAALWADPVWQLACNAARCCRCCWRARPVLLWRARGQPRAQHGGACA
jgi:hypothetical protein